MIGMRRRAVTVAVVTVLLASLGLPPAVGAKLAGDKVRLGVIMPQAGLFVDWGQHGLIGAEFARDEINAAGGIGGLPLELVVVYDRGDPKEALTLTRPLAQTDLVLMIPGAISSSNADVMFPLSASFNRPMITPTPPAPPQQPDLPSLGSGSREAALIAKEARKPGSKGPIHGGVATATPALIALGGDAVEGWYTTTYAWNERPIPRVQTFVKKFLERSGGKRPNSSGLAMYDQLFISKMCVETSGVTNKPDDLESDRDKLAKCWSGLKSYDGAIGAVTMNELGVNVGQIWALIVKRGVFTLAE